MTLTADTAAAADQLALEVAALRRDLAALREALSYEVRTRRIVVDGEDGCAVEINLEGVIVADAERTVELSPGRITVHHDATGSYVQIGAYPDRAEVVVEANDILPIPADGTQQVAIVAWAEWDCEPGGPYAEVTVNGEALPMPAPT